MSQQKRLKTAGPVKQQTPAYVVMSPLLAIAMHIYRGDCLLESDWKVRQHAAKCLSLVLLEEGTSLDYSVVDEALQIVQTGRVRRVDLMRALVPQVFMVMVKDHFNDFEELKVITPVREETANLLITIVQSSRVEGETVLQSLP